METLDKFKYRFFLSPILILSLNYHSWFKKYLQVFWTLFSKDSFRIYVWKYLIKTYFSVAMEQKRVDNLGSFVSLLIIRKFSKIVNIVYKKKLFNNIRIKLMEIHPPTTKLAKKKINQIHRNPIILISVCKN